MGVRTERRPAAASSRVQQAAGAPRSPAGPASGTTGTPVRSQPFGNPLAACVHHPRLIASRAVPHRNECLV